jgi:hypothetical protein
VKPKSDEAKEIFEYTMLGLQSCEILDQQGKMYLLKPIKANYQFWMSADSDVDWELDK